MHELVTLSKSGRVAVITIDNPPVNALATGVPEGLLSSLEAAQSAPDVDGIVLIGAGRTFIAGADINEFARTGAGPNLHHLLAAMEDCPKPLVTAIHGTALGGGLEIAMAAHYRVAVADAQMGLPEATLGIVPGAEGTQRLPRLVGVARAVEMLVTAQLIKAPEALALGLIDRVIEGDLLAGAVSFAQEMAAKGCGHPKTRERNEKLGSPETNAPIFAAGREQARKLRRNQPAPLMSIEAVEAATTLPFEEACRKERELSDRSLASTEAKALIHAFLAERAVSKIPDIPKDTPVLPLRQAAIIGAGTMGGGIAMAFANAGIPVRITDSDEAALDRGIAAVRRNYESSVKRGRFTQEVMDQRMALIRPQLGYGGFDEADIIVEAVFESLDLKRKIFAELDGIAKADCVLASNTSTLDIDKIAAATTRPHMVIGLHFFSPAHVMRLVEIVRGRETGKTVIATAMSLAKTLRKVGVLVGNCHGFVGNRMMFAYMREAQFLCEEGATPSQVDNALTEWGMAMGIHAVDDMGGIDVLWRVKREMKSVFDRPGVRKPLVHDKLYEMGRLGQKTGAGWFRYDETRKPIPDPEIEALIERTAVEAGIPRRTITNEEIVERCVYALVNEGSKILEEGYALRAADIDTIYMTGYGFPGYRGGPMWYAETVGLAKVYARIQEFERQHGELWKPSSLLVGQVGHLQAGWEPASAAVEKPYRDVNIIPLSVTVERKPGGVVYVRTDQPLGPYPDRMTDRLDYWAEHAPDRTFIAQRAPDGEWRRLTYAQAQAQGRNIGQALVNRGLGPDRPIAILSGNDIEHALLGFGAMYAGVPYSPISTAYSLVSKDFGKLRHIVGLLTPGLVFAASGPPFARAIEAVIPKDAELVFTKDPLPGATLFAELENTVAGPSLDAAHARVTPDTILKVLFTSGSTGVPKGVINTHRMWCSNHEMVRTCWPFLVDEPPVLLEWLPWNHTFAGNKDFGLVLYNGGSLYLDDGKPVPGAYETSLRNLREIATTIHLNVPKGFEAMVPYLRAEPEFRKLFFSRLKFLFYAGAGLSQKVWDDLEELSIQTTGERILMLTGLGSTETAPFAMVAGKDVRRAGEVGLPAPGVELKLVPTLGKLEARVRGPSITPGYWRQDDLTRAAFDEEGFYKFGDALSFVDEQDPNKGFVFDGRVAEDFKLSTGTWVSVGPMRGLFLSRSVPYAREVVIAGHDRDFVGVLVFPDLDACRELCPELPASAGAAAVLSSPGVRENFRKLLKDLAKESSGSSNRIARAMLMDVPASIDAHELTDKGSISQRAVLENRAALVEELYAGSPRVIAIDQGAK